VIHLRRRQKHATVSRATSSRKVAINPVRVASKTFPAPGASVGRVKRSPAESVTRPPLSPATNDDWLGPQSPRGATIHKQFLLISVTNQPRCHGNRCGVQKQQGQNQQRYAANMENKQYHVYRRTITLHRAENRIFSHCVLTWKYRKQGAHSKCCAGAGLQSLTGPPTSDSLTPPAHRYIAVIVFVNSFIVICQGAPPLHNKTAQMTLNHQLRTPRPYIAIFELGLPFYRAKVLPRQVVCPPVCDVEVSWSYRLEFCENNFTAD